MVIYVLYTCNAWHDSSTYEMVGVFSTQEKAVNKAKNVAIEMDCFDEDELEEIVESLMADWCPQTQGFDTNFSIEKWDVE